MIDAEGLSPSDGIPEADRAEQRLAADVGDEEAGLDPAHLEDIHDKDANPADVIDQAISVPLPHDDYDIEQ